MAITMQQNRVAVICDHCKKPIVTAADGNCEWADVPGSIQNTMFFTHKQCSRDFECKLGLMTRTMELSMLPLRIAANLSVDVERSIEMAGYFAEMG